MAFEINQRGVSRLLFLDGTRSKAAPKDYIKVRTFPHDSSANCGRFRYPRLVIPAGSCPREEDRVPAILGVGIEAGFGLSSPESRLDGPVCGQLCKWKLREI